MVVDTSAILAVLFGEPERAEFLNAIKTARRRPALSAMTLLETSMVAVGRRGWRVLAPLDTFIAETMEVVPLDDAMARIARDAFYRYGKGRHPAGLNFGDCASYALAKMRRTGLLFKGGDFSRTDVEVAMS